MTAPEEQETVDGTVKSVVFRNDENGFTILHVTLVHDGRFRLAEREVTVLGTCAAAWEGCQHPVPHKPWQYRQYS